MLSRFQSKKLQSSILAGTLILEFVKSCYVPVQAAQLTPAISPSSSADAVLNNPESFNPVTDSLNIAGARAVVSFGGACTPGSQAGNLNPDSAPLGDQQLLAQLPQPLPEGGACPAEFTNIPCGEGEDLLCEVGGPQPNAIGGAELLPLLASSGPGIAGPLAGGLGGLAAVGGLAAGLSGGGDGGGSSSSTPSGPGSEPIPEPSMVPASVLALGFLYLARKRRSSKLTKIKGQGSDSETLLLK